MYGQREIRAHLPGGLLAVALALPCLAMADGTGVSGKLLLTGGVSQVEGAGGGGLTPWAVIGGYGTRDQVGANAFYTRVSLPDYHLDAAGVMVGLYNRVELSYAQQRFDTEDVGAALGLGHSFTFRQDVGGVKVRLFRRRDPGTGQLAAAGLDRRAVQGKPPGCGGEARRCPALAGTDYYLNASKLFLAQSLLVNATVRPLRLRPARLLTRNTP